MKRSSTQKKLATLAIAVSSACILTTPAFAQGTGILGASTNSIVIAIEHLGDRISGLFNSAIKEWNDQNYQPDKNLPATAKANTVQAKNQPTPNKTDDQNQNQNAPLTPNQIVAENGNKSTQENITQSLRQFAYAVTPPPQDSQAAQQWQQYQNNNSPATLATSIKASDTLYTAALNHPFKAQELGTTQPKQLNDNYFNFDSLFIPVAYTSPQLTAAQHYVQYSTKDYQDLVSTVDFAKLRGATPSVLKQVMDSGAYQKFQLNTRSALAGRSLALSNLDKLIAERTPIKDLGKAAGLQDENGKTIDNASPLQVEKYIATHRIHSKKWYQEMAAASPAVIQRETLFVLAEIEAQNYRAHLDNERLLATMTALAAENSQASALLAQTDAQAVNSVIANATNTKPPQQGLTPDSGDNS